MKLGFRWFGEADPVTLLNISQIPSMHSVVSAVYEVPVGEVWPKNRIAHISEAAKKYGLVFDVVESVPVHEDIKLGKKSRDKYIAAYAENISRLAEAGIKCVCYNFMPIFDWIRTELCKANINGSTSLAYCDCQLATMNPLSGTMALPGWDSSYKKEDIKRLFDCYSDIGPEDLFQNLVYFLERLLPTLKRTGVKLAVHPDDPPWDVFGLPRIVNNERNLDRLLAAVDDDLNGLTFCTGSIGADEKNDVVALLDKYSKAGRVHFLHLRNIKLMCGGFEETAHDARCGSLDTVGVLKVLHNNGFDGYIRPDHGRMIWGETGKPGYGLYDRALGASYINGIWQAFDYNKR